MTQLLTLWGRVIDACFDGWNALWRVFMRGAFVPDARSFRSRRFQALSADDILVQEVAINAADAQEARKAILLDGDKYLPFAADQLVLDIAGPLDAPKDLKAGPERRYILGLVQKPALDELRRALPRTRRHGVEAFVHVSAGAPNHPLTFADVVGVRRQHLRRSLLALALAFAWFAISDSLNIASAAFEAEVSATAEQRTALERRLRLTMREQERIRANAAVSDPTSALRLADAARDLELAGLHLHPGAQLDDVALTDGAWAFNGTTYDANATELSLRRAIAGRTFTFHAEGETAPVRFRAALPAAGPSP